MAKIIENLLLAKNLLLKPEDFFQNLKENKINWIFPIVIYITYIIFNSLFLNYRPLDFPNELAALNIVDPSFLFYFGIQFFWGTLTTVIFVALAVFLIKFYNFKFSIALFSCVISVIAGVYILKILDNFLLQSILLSIFISVSVYIIRKNTNNFLFLLKAGFSVNLISILFLPILFLSVFLKSEIFFLISGMIIAIWLLILFVKTIKTISTMSVLKTILIFAFSAIGTFGMFYLLVKINLLSENTFKVILSM
jgi:hypothetical protein